MEKYKKCVLHYHFLIGFVLAAHSVEREVHKGSYVLRERGENGEIYREIDR